MVLDFNSPYVFPRHFDRLFQEFFKSSLGNERKMAYPPINLSEDDGNIYVRSEIPGVDIADIELTLHDKSLVIRGERKAVAGKYLRQERPAGGFQRVVTLNVPVDRDKVGANMTDGVLTVTLPKAEESQPKKISIGVE